MSRRKSEKEYEKTFACHFFRWMDGERDPYLGEVEMQPQEAFQEAEGEAEKRLREKNILLNQIYGRRKSRSIRNLERFYRVASVVFCGILIYLLLLTVSYLPPIGVAERPINNEVSARYIEKGLEETGAINIVSGMILDYRAFDTLGESHVLFVATVTVLILLRLDPGKKDYAGVSREEVEANDRRYEPNVYVTHYIR